MTLDQAKQSIQPICKACHWSCDTPNTGSLSSQMKQIYFHTHHREEVESDGNKTKVQLSLLQDETLVPEAFCTNSEINSD